MNINTEREIAIINSLLCDMTKDFTVEDLQDALEDGEYLANIGATDEDTEEIRDIYARLEDYQFDDRFDVITALEDIIITIKDENAPVIVLKSRGHYVDIECMSKDDFRRSYELEQHYDDWKFEGGYRDDVFDCDTAEALDILEQWFDEDQISKKCFDICCACVNDYKIGTYYSISK